MTNGSLDLASLETICFWAQQTGLLNQTLADVNEHRANERPKHVGQVEIASLRVGTLLLVKQPGNRKPQRARFQAPLGGQKVSLRYIESDAKAPVFDEKGVLAEEAVPEMLSKNVEEVDRKKIAVLAEL